LKKQLICVATAPFATLRNATQKGRMANTISIRERPASAEDRAVPGHWEGDLLCGSKSSQIISLVERHSRYLMLAKIPNRETQTVVNALIKQARKLPDELNKSLTWDNGGELAGILRQTRRKLLANSEVDNLRIVRRYALAAIVVPERNATA
jgi:IS30 family transposase